MEAGGEERIEEALRRALGPGEGLDSILDAWKGARVNGRPGEAAPAKAPSNHDQSRTPSPPTDLDKAVAVRKESFSSTLRSIRTLFGPAGDLIVYQIGFESGRKMPVVPEEGFAKFSEVYTANGWGRIGSIVSESNLSVVRVVMFEGMECRGQTSGRPHSEFIKGHLAGRMSRILGGEISCVEERCIAVGDWCCEFVITCRRTDRGRAQQVGKSQSL